MRINCKGFTLIEVMIALSVVAILLAVAVPAWSNVVSASHNSAARTELAGTLLDAIRHSATANTEVVLCSDAGTLRCTGDTDWSGGWMAFADSNGNRMREASERLIHRTYALTGGVHLRSTVGRTRLVFQPSGGNAGSNATFTLCDRRGPRSATTVVLANDGRLRQGTPTDAAAQACVYGN